MSVLIKNGRRYGGAGTMTYTELSDKPSINNVTLSGNKTTSDLGLFSGDYDDLTDKPTLGTAAALDVAASGDAGNNEVVLGNDSRLSDARQASDVYSWAKAENKPDYDADEIDYDNTESGLTADNVQDAIDEIVGSMGGGTAEDITYDNTDSGMQATDVQDAVDELSASKANGEGLSFFVQNGILCVSTPPEPLVAFSTATDAQIAGILDAYYNGEYTLAQIQEVWHVGDTRTIHLDAMQAPNPNSSSTWVAQDIVVTIVAFNHTDLATAINGKTKACITVQTREVLSSAANTAGTIYVNGDSSYDMSFTKWSDLYMRTYLNDKVWGAFPSTFKSAIKLSKHYRHTNYNTSDAEQVTDNLFLPSYPEIFGTASYSTYAVTSPTEGTQFPYYETASNRIKYNNNNGASGGSAQIYWTGSTSSYYNSSNGYNWCQVRANGTASDPSGDSARGLAPAFAM